MASEPSAMDLSKDLIPVPLWPPICRVALGKTRSRRWPCSILVVQVGSERRSPYASSFALSATPQEHGRHLGSHQATFPFPSDLFLSVPEVLLGTGTFLQRPAVRELAPNYTFPIFPSYRYFPSGPRFPWGYPTGLSLLTTAKRFFSEEVGKRHCFGDVSNAFLSRGSIKICCAER